MNQAQLIDAIADDPRNEGFGKTAVKFVLDSQARITQSALAIGGEVTLPGIGKLTVKVRAARTGRNPATGAPLDIPARKAPHFSAAKALKEALQEVPSGQAVA